VSEWDFVEAARKLNLLLFRLKAEATRQNPTTRQNSTTRQDSTTRQNSTPQIATGLPRGSGDAAKAGTIRAQ
jgi:hypothetical protein